jgi:hypothetical protein
MPSRGHRQISSVEGGCESLVAGKEVVKLRHETHLSIDLLTLEQEYIVAAATRAITLFATFAAPPSPSA